MSKDRIKAFVDDFLKALLTYGNVEKVLSFFAPNATMTGYLGEVGSNKPEDIRDIILIGVDRGLLGFEIEYYNFDISSPVKGAYNVIVDCAFVHANKGFRKIEKRIILFISEDGESLKINVADFSLIYQSEFEKLRDLEKVNNALKKELTNSLKVFDVAVSYTALSTWEYDIKNKCIHQNERAVAIQGFDNIVENVPDSLIEINYVHPESAKKFRDMYERISSGEKKVVGIFKVLDTKLHKYRWEKITYITEFDVEGKPERAIGFSTDVTENVEMSKQLEKIRLQKQALARNAILTVTMNLTKNVVIDLDMNEYFDSKLAEFKKASDMTKYYVENILDVSHRVDVEKLLSKDNLLREYEKENKYFQIDYIHTLPNGENIWAMLNIDVERDEITGDYFANCYLENIDRRKKRELKAKRDAEQDSLTKVYNRLAFKVLAENAIARNPIDSITVFGVLDVDDFKNVNDKEGHYYGDTVLIRVAEIMKKCFRQNDVVGRLGGDEFVFLLTNVSDVEFIKKKFHILFRELHTVDDVIKNPIHVSLGIAISPWDGNEFDVLYKKADTALYNAKKSGKNKWCIYDEKIDGQ